MCICWADQRSILFGLCYEIPPINKDSDTDTIYHFWHTTVFASGNIELMVCEMVFLSILGFFNVTEPFLWRWSQINWWSVGITKFKWTYKFCVSKISVPKWNTWGACNVKSKRKLLLEGRMAHTKSDQTQNPFSFCMWQVHSHPTGFPMVRFHYECSWSKSALILGVLLCLPALFMPELVDWVRNSIFPGIH